MSARAPVFSGIRAGVMFAALIAFAAEAGYAASSKIPFGGYNIDEDRSLAKRLYPDALKDHFDEKASGVSLSTPTLDRMASGAGGLASDEQGAPARFTTNEEIADFIGSLPEDFLRRQDLAAAGEKRETGEAEAAFTLPAMIFSNPPVSDLAGLRESEKPVVWFQAQVHGDEPAGADAMLAVARDLSENREGVLDAVAVVIVPRVNADGAMRNRRGADTAYPGFAEIDLNRDTLAALSPVTSALRGAFAECRPDVFVDFHEMGLDAAGPWQSVKRGQASARRYYGGFDLATLVAHPYNVPKEITELALRLEEEIARAAVSAGLTTARYSYDASRIAAVKGTAREGAPTGYIMMEGPPDECIADSASALSPSVSLLVETRGPQILVNFKTRVFAHYVAASSVLRKVASSADIFREAVARGGAEISNMGANPSCGADVVLWVKQGEARDAPVSVLALDTAKNRLSREVLNLRRLHVNDALTPVKSVSRPYAYILSADEAEAPRLANRLALTGVKLGRLPGGAAIRVEAYRVKSVASSGNERLSYGARSGDYFPVNRTLTYAIDEVETLVREITFPKGTYFFLMAQPSANLAALAVEPAANRNLGNYWYTLHRADEDASGFLPFEKGGEFPAYRCMSAADFSAASVDE